MRNDILYVSAAQHLNNAIYDVRVPAYAISRPDREFDPVTEEVYYDQGVKITQTTTDPLGFLPSSFYQYPSAESRVTTGMTIVQIMRLVEDKIDCALKTPEDTIEIFCCVDDYLKEVRNNVFNKETEYVDFVRRLIPFRQEMYFHFRWAIQKNSEWRKYFDRKYHNVHGNGLRALMGMAPDMSLNGVIQLSTPPYSIKDIDAVFAAPEAEKRTKDDGKERVSIQDYLNGDRGAVKARNPFQRGNADERESADIANKYLG